MVISGMNISDEGKRKENIAVENHLPAQLSMTVAHS